MTRWASIRRDDHAPARVVVLLLLAVLAAVAVGGMFMAGRWAGHHLGAAGPRTVGAGGVWCGRIDEAMRLELVQGAGGELHGGLSFGGRPPMMVAGRVEDGGVVVLRTVRSTLWFELAGALVGDRLRLNVTDDAGDTGRVELRHC